MRTRNTDKEQLVKQKAMELVVKRGLDGFSMNKLAKECGISVATLYIYYKDKDDLITAIGMEEGNRMTEYTLRDFDPEAHFADGLRIQWRNRYAYMTEHPTAMLFLEIIRGTAYDDKIFDHIAGQFRCAMGQFMANACERGEVQKLPLEVYWSVAFAPLYILGRFEHEGRNMGNKPFVMTDKILWQTFDLVIKALTP